MSTQITTLDIEKLRNTWGKTVSVTPKAYLEVVNALEEAYIYNQSLVNFLATKGIFTMYLDSMKENDAFGMTPYRKGKEAASEHNLSGKDELTLEQVLVLAASFYPDNADAQRRFVKGYIK